MQLENEELKSAAKYTQVDPLVLKRVVAAARDFLRARGFHSESAVTIVSQVLTWIKLSQTGILSDEWNVLHQRERWNDEQLRAVETYFTSLDPQVYGVAFYGLANRLKPLDRKSVV